MVSTLLRMTNQFAFRKTERPWQMMASLCRFMCHSSSLWKTEQKSVRPMEKAGKKFGKVYLTSKAAQHTLCCSPATLIQLSVTCLFCSLELLRRRAAWENGGNNRFSKRRFSLRFDAYFHESKINIHSFLAVPTFWNIILPWVRYTTAEYTKR